MVIHILSYGWGNGNGDLATFIPSRWHMLSYANTTSLHSSVSILANVSCSHDISIRNICEGLISKNMSWSQNEIHVYLANTCKLVSMYLYVHNCVRQTHALCSSVLIFPCLQGLSCIEKLESQYWFSRNHYPSQSDQSVA